MLVSLSLPRRKENSTFHTLNFSSSSSLSTWVTRSIWLLVTRICGKPRGEWMEGLEQGGSAASSSSCCHLCPGPDVVPLWDACVGVAEALGFFVVGRVALLEWDDGILEAWEVQREGVQALLPSASPTKPFPSPGVLPLGIFPTVFLGINPLAPFWDNPVPWAVGISTASSLRPF